MGEWLLQRRYISKDWIKRTVPLRAKLTQLVSQLEESAKTDLVLRDDSGRWQPDKTCIESNLTSVVPNYFQCRQVMDKLQGTSEAEKNLWGQYTNPRTKLLGSILSDYEKDNLFIADAAHALNNEAEFSVYVQRSR